MGQLELENLLFIVHLLCSIFGVTSSITNGIAWGHWRYTLDQCVNNVNCSCILYGKYTPSKFLGGDVAPCIWVTFGPILYVLYTVSMAGFHGYRVLFSTQSTTTRTFMGKNEAGALVQMRAVQTPGPGRLPPAYWTTSAVLSAIFALYGLVHFAIFLDGFYRTCNQYRKMVEQMLGIHGTAVPVLHNRLACQAIYDFMDYMQPDSFNAYRDGTINTGAALTIGIVSAFLAWALLALASVTNVRLRRVGVAIRDQQMAMQ